MNFVLHLLQIELIAIEIIKSVQDKVTLESLEALIVSSPENRTARKRVLLDLIEEQLRKVPQVHFQFKSPSFLCFRNKKKTVQIPKVRYIRYPEPLTQKIPRPLIAIQIIRSLQAIEILETLRKLLTNNPQRRIARRSVLLEKISQSIVEIQTQRRLDLEFFEHTSLLEAFIRDCLSFGSCIKFRAEFD